MNPITRNAPSWSSPVENDVPIARPSPRLWTPMPSATRKASARPGHPGAAARETRGEERHPERAGGDPEEHETRPAERGRERGLELERLGERLDAEEGQQAARERHERREPARVGAPERRQPEQAERDRHDADEEPDEPVPEEAACARLRRQDRRRDLLDRLDPRRARHSDGDGVVRDPGVRDDDRARAEPLERRRPVERERHDRVVDGDGRDRQVVPLRVSHLDADLALAELDAADVELVGRRRRAAEQVDDAVALRDDERDGDREQHDRHERPEPPAETPLDGRRRFH